MVKLLGLLLSLLIVGTPAQSQSQPQSSTLSLFEIGRQLPFHAADIESIRYEVGSQPGVTFAVLTIAPDMATLLHRFTQALQGETILTVMGDQLLSSDIVIREPISSRVLHLSGSDDSLIRGLVTDLNQVLTGVSDEPVMVTYEQLTKRSYRILSLSPTGPPGTDVSAMLGLSADGEAWADGVDQTSGWMASVNDTVLQSWSLSTDESTAELMVLGLSDEDVAWLTDLIPPPQSAN